MLKRLFRMNNQQKQSSEQINAEILEIQKEIRTGSIRVIKKLDGVKKRINGALNGKGKQRGRM